MDSGDALKERPDHRIAGDGHAGAAFQQRADVTGKHDAIAESLLGKNEDIAALDRLPRLQHQVSQCGAALAGGKAGPAGLVDAGFVQRKAFAIFAPPQQCHRKIESCLRIRRRQRVSRAQAGDRGVPMAVPIQQVCLKRQRIGTGFAFGESCSRMTRGCLEWIVDRQVSHRVTGIRLESVELGWSSSQWRIPWNSLRRNRSERFLLPTISNKYWQRNSEPARWLIVATDRSDRPR